MKLTLRFSPLTLAPPVFSSPQHPLQAYIYFLFISHFFPLFQSPLSFWGIISYIELGARVKTGQAILLLEHVTFQHNPNNNHTWLCRKRGVQFFPRDLAILRLTYGWLDFFPHARTKKKWSTEYFLGVVVFRHAIDFWLVCTDRGVI